MLSPEPLRLAAIEALGPHADLRARDALSHAILGIESGITAWEGSAGTVRAHRVLLGLTAHGLANLERAPGVRDDVNAALAAAIAAQPGEAMAELRAYWALEDATGEGSYRGGPLHEARRDDPAAVRDALGVFLRASGEIEAAAHVARARIALGAGKITFVFTRGDWHGLKLDPAWSARIEHAAEVLLAGISGATVRVVWRVE